MISWVVGHGCCQWFSWGRRGSLRKFPYKPTFSHLDYIFLIALVQSEHKKLFYTLQVVLLISYILPSFLHFDSPPHTKKNRAWGRKCLPSAISSIKNLWSQKLIIWAPSICTNKFSTLQFMYCCSFASSLLKCTIELQHWNKTDKNSFIHQILWFL